MRLGTEMGDVVFAAMKDTKVKGTLADMVRDKKIQIVDKETGAPKYEQHIEAEIEGDDNDGGLSPERNTKTTIKVKDGDLFKLEKEVKGAIERQRTGKDLPEADDELEQEVFQGDDDVNERVEEEEKEEKHPATNGERLEGADATLNDRVAEEDQEAADHLLTLFRELRDIIGQTKGNDLKDLKAVSKPS
jgi:hypothetical protein